MIFSSILVTFIVLSNWVSHLVVGQSTKKSDPNSCYGRLDSKESESDSETNIQSNKYSGRTSSGSKKLKIGSSSANKRGERKRPQYRGYTIPINPKIDENMENFLREKEQELAQKSEDRLYYWEDYQMEVTQDRIEYLCINAVESVKMRLQFKKELTSDMKPDCDGGLILGPSNLSLKGIKYIGFFQYAPEFKKKSFFGDILRCNCVFIEKKECGNIKVVSNSKHFFYLMKASEELYYVLTISGDIGSRDLKIVSILNI